MGIILISLNQVSAFNISDFIPILDRRVEKIETLNEKIDFLKNLSNLLTNEMFTQGDKSDFFEEVRLYSLELLETLQDDMEDEWVEVSLTSTLNLPTLSDNFDNIDEQRVRDAILAWHNEERKNVWVKAYTYNLDLEWSAMTRANNLAKSGKTKNLHPRNSWDGFYNYASMFNWFSGLWIEFPYSSNGAISFSESIGYNYYKCSKSDCTDDLIAAIKKTWTWLIMKEKSYRWSHYNSAVMKHFTQMWAWIAIDNSHNRYYLVLHYGMEF